MSDKTINIIAEAFKVIPAGDHLVKQDKKKDKRYTRLAKYVYQNAIKHNGLHLSSNKEGVAVAYVIDPLKNKKSFSDLINDIKFALYVSGIKNAFKIYKRQKYIQNMRPKKEPYMYWEFSGVNPHYQGMDSASFSMGELRDKVYNDTHERQLPMFTETSIRKNMVVYRRYGFDIYHEWKMPDGTTMWFLKYDTLSKENPVKNKK